MKYYDIGFLWNIMSHGCCDMNQSLQNSQTLGQFFEPLYVYLSYVDHDFVMVNMQVVKHVAFLSMEIA